ncbi:putative ankyrin repeat protein RF_0381 isoform X2 [Stegodyphus dumicola]|uniref:putative ankyrin repeat protein RF_0381 isoform X2 n=1 Tax=Stegodyphus dumicola TaxID=202533 RepID=UPI0015AC95A1|nr:putative ankyrin repeat protein RF_0381 isoform X2 [Stegodyphus dumicola]
MITSNLCSYGADVNAVNLEDFTSLHYAVMEGNLEIVQLLIQHGADVCVPLGCKPPPLHFAVVQGSVEILEFLLNSGADINAVSNMCGTALHLALTKITGNQLELVKTLLQRGANPNAITVSDNTRVFKPPIEEYLKCCEHLQPEIIQLLLRYGARIVLKEKRDHPLGIIKVIHRIHLGLNPEVMALLIEACEEFDVNFIKQSQQMSNEHRELLLNRALQPFPLMHLARIELRKNLGWGPHFIETVQNLKIPEYLKSYVLFDK